MEHSHHLHMDAPGLFDLWNPWVLLIVLAIGFLYFYAVGPMRRSFAGCKPVSAGKKANFTIGLLLFWSVQGTPVHYYGHSLLFSSHMLEQSVVYLMVPPFIYLGLPDWLVRPLFERSWMKRFVYPLTHPLLSVLGFNLIFSIYHLPLVFNSMGQSEFLHNGYHLLLLATAFHMWFPVFCPLPEWNRLSELQRMAYIFANGVLLTPACALIIFADTLLYDAYLDAPVVISWLHGLDDQQLGGVVMKIIQEIVYGTVLAYCFFKWYRMERRDEEEPVPVPAEADLLTVPPKGRLNRA